jgi:GDP-mannose 6-dehydrogenase
MKEKKVRVSIFGLGYVGTVSAACLAKSGHTVIGVDTNVEKVALLNEGLSPIVEKDVPDLVAEARRNETLRATADIRDAVLNSDISLICVGTPSRRDGGLDVTAVERVCHDIGLVLAGKAGPHVVTIRSTVLPGTTRDVIIPALEQASGKALGKGLSVCGNPEFLREGTAVYDFHNPPKTVVGGSDAKAVEAVLALYEGIDAPVIVTSIETAEMVKYTDNCWHAVKVAFGNEIGNICQSVGVDSHEVIDIFLKDTKLNISPAYLKPGFAFGGSCLPKDLRALTFKGRSLSLELPLLNNVLPSNRVQIERAIDMIISSGKRKVGFLGISFKEGTDDMRESPQIEVIERLIGKGYGLRLYDSNVRISGLLGANRMRIMESIPHIGSLMVDRLDDVLAEAEIVVVGNNAPEFADIVGRLRPDQILVDLVRVKNGAALGSRYLGVNW